LRRLGALNLSYGGKQITEGLAKLADPNNRELLAFQEQQQELIKKIFRSRDC
jgi:hypothetical protein